MEEYSSYQNPLLSRYGSEEMSGIFSDVNKFKLWRKIWIALAESQHELGLNITAEQLAELRSFSDNINFDVAKEREKKVRHDIMAHLHAYGVQCKKAAGIIHLGATSCDITDNADIIIIDSALKLIKQKLVNVIEKLTNFAEKYKNAPTLGYTHLQPALLTTIGKRATLWINDLVMDFQNLNYIISNIKLRGIKGTVGTQASFLLLFENDAKKVKALEKRVLEKLGYKDAYEVTGQTYSRKFDYNILSLLSQIASSCYKFSNDLRILQGLKEMEEPFEDFQIGSSAMAYKRNPMRSERMGALCKFVISLPVNAAMTASTQWFERTLDDSANRRIVLAQGFLAIDAVLNLYLNISENLVVNDKIIYKHIMEELPFMATEAILVECVKMGGNRQEVHEKIRVHSMEAAKNVKEGMENNFIELIKNDPFFNDISQNLKKILEPKNFIGLASLQVDEFITYIVKPILNANGHLLGLKSDVKV